MTNYPNNATINIDLLEGMHRIEGSLDMRFPLGSQVRIYRPITGEIFEGELEGFTFDTPDGSFLYITDFEVEVDLLTFICRI